MCYSYGARGGKKKRRTERRKKITKKKFFTVVQFLSEFGCPLSRFPPNLHLSTQIIVLNKLDNYNNDNDENGVDKNYRDNILWDNCENYNCNRV